MVTVHLFAAARAAAGVSSITVDSMTVAEILNHCANLNANLSRIIPQCSVLLDSVICHDYNLFVNSGQQLDLLPKFAGG